ncbi:MAG: amidotransferase 1, exosortase A system-associated, partial [Alphaproteobacteria bacterium]|nr:amidotransferase 1, exosortase A system-associated [Alphaproteobacteria bacterium]
MCGIAGYFDLREHRSIPEPVLRAMTDAIAHRGPDGADLWRIPGVGFGHRRLAIIDLEGGRQPMATPDGRVTVLYNGEIYNFMDVRRDLEARGHRFHTDHSDTEVILYAWLEWGEACVERFRGMFAFALFDAKTRTLFLARDRLGVKPLHYAELGDGTLIFGSELKALVAHPKLRRDIDPAAIEDYFAYGYIPDPKCVLTSVRKLEAGHTLTLQSGKPMPQPRRYWDVDFTTRHRGKPADLAAELAERMREAVRLRMIADVPLGAFLSGGVDSSAVVALMAGLSDQPVNTCSIGFDVAGYDETDYAAQIARRYATNHRARIVSPEDFALVDRLAEAYDEPYADASALPTYRVCALARETVTVALSGDGADEAFAGYRRYRMHAAEERVRAHVPLGLRRALFGPLGRWYPKLDWAPRFVRGKTTFESLGRTSGEAYFNSIAVTPDRVRSKLLTDGFRRAAGGHWAGALYVDTMASAPASDALGAAQYADIRHWLPGDILTKMDRASMAVSLEAREPLLDHELVQWAAGLPQDLRIRGGEGKWLLKKAMEPFVPKDLLYRPKMGFVVPISDWFRGRLADRIEAVATCSGLLD